MVSGISPSVRSTKDTGGVQNSHLFRIWSIATQLSNGLDFVGVRNLDKKIGVCCSRVNNTPVL